MLIFLCGFMDEKLKCEMLVGFVYRYVVFIMAEILKALSPEQLKALTPECMRIIMGNDMLENDVVEIRHFLNGIKYEPYRGSYGLNDKFGNREFNINGLHNFSKILLKHNKKNLYLTYDICNENECKYISNDCLPFDYKIYTEDEIKKIVPTGCDLEKICFSKGNKNFPFVKYPRNYVKPQNGITEIEHLAFYHDNIHFVHPILMAHAHHFLS